MRLIHVIFTALFALFALVAGIFAAAVVALAGTALFLAKRLRRNPLTSGAGMQRNRSRSLQREDVIEVTATEVAAERIGPPQR